MRCSYVPLSLSLTLSPLHSWCMCDIAPVCLPLNDERYRFLSSLYATIADDAVAMRIQRLFSLHTSILSFCCSLFSFIIFALCRNYFLYDTRPLCVFIYHFANDGKIQPHTKIALKHTTCHSCSEREKKIVQVFNQTRETDKQRTYFARQKEYDDQGEEEEEEEQWRRKKNYDFFGVGFIFHHASTRCGMCSTVYDF